MPLPSERLITAKKSQALSLTGSGLLYECHFEQFLTMAVAYHFPMFPKLEPRTDEFHGGRISHTDVIGLAEAAQLASRHAKVEITVSDFLRAAGRGEITLRAIVHQTARLQKIGGGVYCNSGQSNENIAPNGSILNLPLSACQHLVAVGKASWRDFDDFETIHGVRMRFTAATLIDGEPNFETLPDDCRVTGNHVHALADAFIEELEQITQSPAPGAFESVLGGVEPTQARPLPLTTGDIAFCFAGLRWDEKQWKKPLGDKPKWLLSCIVIPAVRGVSESRWSPVLIGAALVRAGHVKPNSVRAKFQTLPLLKPWLDEWKTYEANNFAAD